MARPGKVFIRKALRGIEIPIDWKPPECALEWLNERLQVANGFDRQLAAHSWCVWQVWRHERIDKARVMLLCCVGDRQAIDIMNYAEALDRFMCGVYGAGARIPLMADLSDCDEYRTGYRWERWAALAEVQRGMSLRPEQLARIRAILSQSRMEAVMRRVVAQRMPEHDDTLQGALRRCEDARINDL